MDARFEPRTMIRICVAIVLGCLVSGIAAATGADADASDGYGITVASLPSPAPLAEAPSIVLDASATQ